MYTHFPSSNPFRHKGAAPIPEMDRDAIPVPHTTGISRVKPAVKMVRLQPDHQAFPTLQSPLLPPIPSPHPNPFGLHEPPRDMPVSEPKNAPPNPFAKTLENLDPPEARTTGVSTRVPSKNTVGRASLDVDAFKRLMTLGSPGPTSSNHSNHHGIGRVPDGTSTDAMPRPSMFESIQGNVSPRTSHELSKHDDDLVQDFNTGRTKPPPPNSRHGKLIKMELRDDPGQMRIPSRPSSSSSKASQYPSSSPLTRSQTDLNKPLPAAPRFSSSDLHYEERESIFDRESAGKIPEPASPMFMTRKAPPPPPITRRHSQLVSKSINGSESGGRLSPKMEEQPARPLSLELGRDRLSGKSSGAAPAPPPTRRPASLRSSSLAPSISTASLASIENSISGARFTSPPPPPPPRSFSMRKLNRPASVISMESHKEPHARSGAPPPPPPRHRESSRNSIDSSVLSRGNSFGRGALDADVLDQRIAAEPEDMAKGPDILADLSALQREVEAALRAQQKRVC